MYQSLLRDLIGRSKKKTRAVAYTRQYYGVLEVGAGACLLRYIGVVPYLRCYLETSRQLGDRAAEGAACCAFAECQQQLGELEGAVQSLEEYLELSRSQVGSMCLVFQFFKAL
jgi:hypothetical protein